MATPTPLIDLLPNVHASLRAAVAELEREIQRLDALRPQMVEALTALRALLPDEPLTAQDVARAFDVPSRVLQTEQTSDNVLRITPRARLASDPAPATPKPAASDRSDLTDHQRGILGAIRASRVPVSVQELATAIGWTKHRQQLSKDVRDLRDRGLLVMVGARSTAKWTVPSKASSESPAADAAEQEGDRRGRRRT